MSTRKSLLRFILGCEKLTNNNDNIQIYNFLRDRNSTSLINCLNGNVFIDFDEIKDIKVLLEIKRIILKNKTIKDYENI